MSSAALDGSGAAAQRTLADAIMTKIKQQQDADGQQPQQQQQQESRYAAASGSLLLPLYIYSLLCTASKDFKSASSRIGSAPSCMVQHSMAKQPHPCLLSSLSPHALHHHTPAYILTDIHPACHPPFLCPVSLAGLDSRVLEVYRGVGQLMARYTVGSVPKAFKIIPSLMNWEEVLQLTEPEQWSPHAM